MRTLLVVIVLSVTQARAAVNVSPAANSNSVSFLSVSGLTLSDSTNRFKNTVQTNHLHTDGLLFNESEPTLSINGHKWITFRQDSSTRAIYFGQSETLTPSWDALTFNATGIDDGNTDSRIAFFSTSAGEQQTGFRFRFPNAELAVIELGTPTLITGVPVFKLAGGVFIYGSNSVPVQIHGSSVTSQSNFVASAALALTPVTVALAADNQVVSTTNRSFIVFTSNAAAASRTVILTPSNIQGATLKILFSGANGAEMADDQAQTGGGNTRTAGTLTFTDHDVVTFIFEGTDWRQATALLAN